MPEQTNPSITDKTDRGGYCNINADRTDDEGIVERRCVQCGDWMVLELFCKKRDAHLGYTRQCRPCKQKSEKKRGPKDGPKDHGVVFSTEMVKAIIAGRKTQTRRLITKATSVTNAKWEQLEWELERNITRDRGLGAGGYLHVPYSLPNDDWHGEQKDRVRCRWCIRDRLWVKETWYDDNSSRPTEAKPSAPDQYISYRADGTLTEQGFEDVGDRSPWKSPRFMPRWVSRVLLEIVDVQPQRLTEITEEEAKAEGITNELQPGIADEQTFGDPGPHPRTLGSHPLTCNFAVKWDTINGHRVLWQANPWIWAVTFRLLEVRERVHT